MNRKWLAIVPVILTLAVGAPLVGAARSTEARVVAFDEITGRVRWVAAAGADYDLDDTAVAAANGRVFAWFSGRDSEQDVVLAFDAASGARLWRFVPDPARYKQRYSIYVERRLIADADAVYVQLWNTDGQLTLVALDPASGAQRWTFAPLANLLVTVGKYAPIARRFADLVVLTETARSGSEPSPRYALQALNPATGKASWRIDLGDSRGGDSQGPFANDQSVVAGLSLRHVAAYRAGSGQQLWTLSGLTGDPTLAGATFYADGATPDDGTPRSLVAYDMTSGQERWSFRYPSARDFSQLAADLDGVFVLASGPNDAGAVRVTLIALSATDGHEQWRAPGAFAAPPLPLRDSVIVRGTIDAQVTVDRQTHGLIVYARADGTERWRQQSGVYGLAADNAGGVFIVEFASRGHDWLSRFNRSWR